ncbi:hypothetical protein LWC34_19250 [Kibdelosporangium philippinense]|uniref:Uncharacterized protein n=1 Tax=Kibdelosporangium philippinense TaxID=211113 RepID=A0ABS8ZGI1_9PSEU|nr:hypothetical protein [Kibdelosporangium philippinense]MCE7004947.1 hypothetical protein [Kibdelosporangium philippinense]
MVRHARADGRVAYLKQQTSADDQVEPLVTQVTPEDAAAVEQRLSTITS